MFFSSLWSVFTQRCFFFFFLQRFWRKRAVLTWPTAAYTPPSLFPSPLEKHAVIGVVSTSGGCCTSSRMSKSPFKPPSPTATGSRLRSGTKLEVWTGEQLSSLFSTHRGWLLLFSVIIFGELTFWASLWKSVELLWLPHVPAALLSHSSLHLCQAQPHNPPPPSHPPNPASPPAVALWLTHGTMPTIQLMYLIDSWNPLMPNASSHGYGTIKYICAYSWMKVRFQQDFLREMWKLCVSQAFSDERMFAGWLTVRCCWCLARPAQGLIFTLRRSHFQPLDKWFGLLNIWMCFYN